MVLKNKEEDEKQEDGIEFDIVDEMDDIDVVVDDITDIVIVDDDIVDVIVVDTIDIDIVVVRYQVAYISVVFIFAIDIIVII